MVSPNNVLSTCLAVIDNPQSLLGTVRVTEDYSRFYFCKTAMGNSNISSANKYTQHSIQYMQDSVTDTLDLKEFIALAEGILVDTKEDCDIDLSPENLSKETILNLLKKEIKS